MFEFTKESSSEEVFENTGRSWEESGSLIYIYNCKICNDNVNSYARKNHLWYHKYLKGWVR